MSMPMNTVFIRIGMRKQRTEDWGLSKKPCLAPDHFNRTCRFPALIVLQRP